MFSHEGTKAMTTAVALPFSIERALATGAALAISISGGKDSQAMAMALSTLYRARDWRGEVFAIHADLGRIEWPQTPAHVQRIADLCDLPLVIVRRKNGVGRWDMIARWSERAETLKAQGKQPRPWSDAKNRFCTAEMKRNPINTYLRQYDHVISAEGIRADESKARAQKPLCETRTAITTRSREAWTWNPIRDWSIQDVWQACGTSSGDLAYRQRLYQLGRTTEALEGWPAHPVYVMGNRRLSCAFCVLGCQSDLTNAARHNPELWQELVGMEREYGFTFQHGKSLEHIGRP